MGGPRPLFLGILVLLAAVAGCIGDEEDQPSSPKPEASERQLTCADPCGQQVDPDGAASTEVDLAVGPSDPDHLVALSATFENRTPEPASSEEPSRKRWLYAHTSRDGGASWTTTRLPGGPQSDPTHPLSEYTLTTDPAVTLLPNGTAIAAGFGVLDETSTMAGGHQRRGLFTMRSPTGGDSWTAITVHVEQSGALVGASGATASAGRWNLSDKNLIASGDDGTVLLAWSQIDSGGQAAGAGFCCGLDLYYALSEDGGKRWTAPTKLGAGYAADPAIGPEGEMYIAFTRSDEGGRHAYLARSSDAEAWTVHRLGNTTFVPFPNLAVHPTGPGKLAVAYPGGGEANPIVVRVGSVDDLGPEIPIAANASNQAGFRRLPSIAWAPDGSIHATYHSGPEDGPFSTKAVALVPCPAATDGCPGGYTRTSATQIAPATTPDHVFYHYKASRSLPGGTAQVWMGGEDPMDLHYAELTTASPQG